MDKVRDIVLRTFKERFGGNMTLNSNLKDNGVNSMNFIQLVISLEETLEVEFEDAQLNINQYDTLEDLVLYIENLQYE